MSGYSQTARHRVGWAITAIESVVQKTTIIWLQTPLSGLRQQSCAKSG